MTFFRYLREKSWPISEDGKGKRLNVCRNTREHIADRRDAKHKDDQATFAELAAKPFQEEVPDENVDSAVGCKNVTEFSWPKGMTIPDESVT